LNPYNYFEKSLSFKVIDYNEFKSNLFSKDYILTKDGKTTTHAQY